MAREHATIKMNAEEVAAFASGESRCIVGTLDEEGGPWGDAAACLYRDGRLFFRVPMKARSRRNIERDDRVCCAIESHPAGSDYYTIKAAIFHGRAERAGAENEQELTDAFAKRPDPVDGGTEGEIFSVGVDDVVSFDFAKIVRRFEQ